MRGIVAYYLNERGTPTRCTPGTLLGVPLEERRPPTDPVAHRGRQGIITDWWSASSRSLVVCGSLRRLRVAMELDFDPDVCRFSGEPVELHWSCETSPRRWRPDFIARTTSGRRLAVAVRPERAGPQWRERLTVLAEVAEQAGWTLTERCVPRGVRAANLAWVADYRQDVDVDPGHEQALLAAFGRPRPVCDAVHDSGLPQLLGMDLAWRLVWQHRLHIDWTRPLLPTAPAWRAPTPSEVA